ncbi:unnamed protein product, partial [Closterium sp. NIES-54]
RNLNVQVRIPLPLSSSSPLHCRPSLPLSRTPPPCTPRCLASHYVPHATRTEGVGLSAPQVGVNVRLMVYNPVGERGKGVEMVLVNPRIVKYAKARDVIEEGCLSFPKIYADVERPMGVKVDAQDINGRKFSISLKEWQARIFQHEYDHLE